MSLLPPRVGIPIAKTRLFGAAVTAVGFGILLYLAASLNVYGLTFTRGLYFVWGVASGVVLGWLEAKLVLAQLRQRTFIWLWKMAIATVVLILAPFLLIMTIFGELQGASFLAYGALFAIPLFLGTSGYQYNKYEKINGVQIFSNPAGFEFWTEPVITSSQKFYRFIRDLQVKDTSTMWQQIGYAKIYQKELEKHPELTAETRVFLQSVFRMFNKYRLVSLTFWTMITFGAPLILAFSLTNGFGLLNLPFGEIMNSIMPLFGAFFVLILPSVLILMHSFKKKMAKLLSQIKPEEIYINETKNVS